MSAAQQEARAALLELIEQKGAELNLLVVQVQNLIALQRAQAAGKNIVTDDVGDELQTGDAVRVKHRLDAMQMAHLEVAQPERWAAMGRSHFQEGLMAIKRAVTQPETF